MADGAYELLHAGVQRQLWRMGWRSLRALQEDSIRAVLTTPGHLLITAATAAGKTEAAFLPVLSAIADEGPGSVRAVYVGPLKALINDQFSRVETLCNYLEVPVYRWHGDVGDSSKVQLIKDPAGVLLITPESLESMFVNRSHALERVFGGLRFVVIDELHSFLDSERGLHLQSLLARLRTLSPQYRLIGLSATIGDAMIAKRYLDPDKPGDVAHLDDKGQQKEVRLKVHAYADAVEEKGDFDEPAPARDTRHPEPARDLRVEEATPDTEIPRKLGMTEGGLGMTGGNISSLSDLQLARDLLTHCRGHANLIFTNAKADAEEFADLCNRLAKEDGLPDAFLVHHGSLSADLREDAETALKSGRPLTAFCSSTLEMGIDIGNVKLVGQIGPPWSVASMKQRLGRSGRRDGEARTMRVYVRTTRPAADAPLFDRLQLKLVQAVAVTELLLEGWVEPAGAPACDLSTLTQQAISVIAQTSGIRADALHAQLCRRGPFRDVDAALFKRLLRGLGAKDVIEQTPEGDLILGLKGEQIRKDKAFYAVFPTAEAFTIVSNGQPLGTIEVAPRVGEQFLFAGMRWQIEDVDTQRRELHVSPAAAYQRPRFLGGGGELHPRLRQKMRDVLADDRAYAYANATALELLTDARAAAQEAQACQLSLIALDEATSALMTWTGTRVQDTLAAIFAARRIDARDQEVAFTFDRPMEKVRTLLGELAQDLPDPLEVAQLVPSRRRRKYDELFDDELLNESLARGWLDVEGAAAVLSGASGQGVG